MGTENFLNLRIETVREEAGKEEGRCEPRWLALQRKPSLARDSPLSARRSHVPPSLALLPWPFRGHQEGSLLDDQTCICVYAAVPRSDLGAPRSGERV